MSSTYTPIATQTLTNSSSSSVTFSSIPSTYTDLVIVGRVLAVGSASVHFQFNGDTASNYSYTVLDGDGATANAARQSPTTNIQFAGWSRNLNSSTEPSTMVANIMSYANTTTFKTASVRSMALGTAGDSVDAFVGTWRSTAAINAIRIECSGTNFAANTIFSLYGIKAE
jgi:hypothetical protein